MNGGSPDSLVQRLWWWLFPEVTQSLEGLFDRDEDISDEWRALDDALQKLTDSTPGTYSKLSHCYQLEVWDCGIACLLMIFRWIRAKGETTQQSANDALLPKEEEERQALINQINSHSIWTPDLVLQLHRSLSEWSQEQSPKYLFCSRAFEVEEDYRNVGYYQDAFGQDEERVTRVFATLQNENANMLCMPNGLPLERILKAVCNPDCIAMVLVDINKLRATGNQGSRGSASYVGHYVLLCGVSQDANDVEQAVALDTEEEKGDYCIALCNPGKPEFMFVTVARFERCRTSSGTDEDIIFITR